VPQVVISRHRLPEHVSMDGAVLHDPFLEPEGLGDRAPQVPEPRLAVPHRTVRAQGSHELGFSGFDAHGDELNLGRVSGRSHFDRRLIHDQFDGRVPVGVRSIVPVADADEPVAELPRKLDRPRLCGCDALDDVGGLPGLTG